MTGHYLTRYAYPVEFLGEIEPSKDLGIVVAIPCFAEENLLNTLQSILECSNPGINVEVIVVINHPANSPGEIVRLNESTFSGATAWSKEANSDWLRFHFIRAFDLPPKIAGVGLARKIAMDEAVRRFIRAGNPHGIIASMDADCTCEKNYLEAIKSHFRENPQSCGANIYFEHNLYEGDSRTTNLGILYYELHLRYMVHALRFADFPYAFHTIGSCMAIPVNIYQKQGGMNTRKAGEDFYFLHKIFPLANFHEIRNTRVIPGSRKSVRVPFGTGKAMTDWATNNTRIFYTYNHLIYKDLRNFIQILTSAFDSDFETWARIPEKVPRVIRTFMKDDNWIEKLRECKVQSRSQKTFNYRLFNWLNGLKIVKFLNYAGREFYPDIPIRPAAIQMLEWNFGRNVSQDTPDQELLEIYRKADRLQ